MHKLFATFALSLIFILGAASSAPGSQLPSNMLVQTDWLAAHLSDKNLVILHVGADRAAYDAQHIPGARFLALSDIAITRNGVPNELPAVSDLKATFERLGICDQSRVVLYGDKVGLFAARAYFTLDYLGHGTSTALLDGGLERWRAENRAISTSSAVVNHATLTVKPRPELIVELAAVKRLVLARNVVLIDARPSMDYSGANAGSTARSGHIPGAKNVFWMDNLISRENPTLKSVAEIRAKYEAAGVKPGSKVVVYCQTGVQAAHDYFTLKLAGFRPALYDGSFFEWSNASGTEVEAGVPASN